MAKHEEIDALVIGDMPIIGGGWLDSYKMTKQSEKRTGRTIWRLKKQAWINDCYHWQTIAQRYSKAELDRIIDKMIVGRLMADVDADGKIIQGFEPDDTFMLRLETVAVGRAG